jgi:hypothetical protein
VPLLALLRIIPVWAWALSAALAWGGWQHHRAAAEGAELLQEQAAASEAREHALLAKIDEDQRRIADQQEVTRDANQAADHARADRAADDRADVQLRQRLAAVRAHAGTCDPAAPAGGESAGDPIGVLADVFGRADERAGILAAYADGLKIAVDACNRDYDALTR